MLSGFAFVGTSALAQDQTGNMWRTRNAADLAQRLDVFSGEAGAVLLKDVLATVDRLQKDDGTPVEENRLIRRSFADAVELSIANGTPEQRTYALGRLFKAAYFIGDLVEGAPHVHTAAVGELGRWLHRVEQVYLAAERQGRTIEKSDIDIRLLRHIADAHDGAVAHVVSGRKTASLRSCNAVFQSAK